MKHGTHVLFTYQRKTFKGRISVENGNTYICQNFYNAGTITEQFGHEFAWNMGNGTNLKENLRVYSVRRISKAAYDAHKDPLVKQVFGYNVHKRKGGIVEFGCGAVTLTTAEIQDFIDNRDEYLKVVKKRDEMQKAVNEETAKVNKWLEKHTGTNRVIAALRGRQLKPENASVEKLRRLFESAKRRKS